MTEYQPSSDVPPAADPWAPPAAVRPSRSRGAWWIAGVVAAVLAAGGGLTAVVLAATDGGLVESIETVAGRPALAPGDCYLVDRRSDRVDSELLTGLTEIPCGKAHNGEVAGTVRLADLPGGEPTGRQIRHAAVLACAPHWDAYAPDGWALPKHVGENHLYPTPRQWALGVREVTCVFDAGHLTSTGSVRVAPGTLNAAQLAYLGAVNPYNRAIGECPVYDDDYTDAELRDWAGKMAEVSEQEAKGLRAVELPEAAKGPMGRLLAAKDEETAAWRSAAALTDPDELADRAAELAEATDGWMYAGRVRKALGLADGASGASVGTPPGPGTQV
ncbi:hypothetical protein ACIRBX_19620 [Kitasatospora sp. NPDC096147]|uniref:hypothetical protein n=1 Tax=Kitasatospora sp. NPDC096147 TaxID=3364093 RepID=UPI0037FD8420